MGQDHESWKDDAKVGADGVKDIRDLPWQKDGGPMPSAEGAVADSNPYDAAQGELSGDERPSNVIGEQSILGYPAPTTDELPSWVKVPDGLAIPPGVIVGFLRFRPEWTSASHKGERQCLLWPLTDQDEQVAYARLRTVDANAVSVLAQHQIRAIDGRKASWNAAEVNNPGNVYNFWREIGPKCRQLVIRWYHQNHALDVEELADFFGNCVALRTMGV